MGAEINRREFLKVFGVAGAGLVVGVRASASGTTEKGLANGPMAQLTAVKKKVVAAVRARASHTPLVWIQGQSCSGCSVSLLNSVHPDIFEILTDFINLEFHQTFMAGTGNIAIKMLEQVLKEQKGGFVLIVEGSIPEGADGHFCDMGEENGKPKSILEWTKALGQAAKVVVAVGACATFGGIPAGKPNPTEAKPFSSIMPEATLINVPGCPAHPDWIFGTLAHVLLFGIPELDKNKRPKIFFGKTVHDNCGRRGDFDEGVMAKDFSEEGCLYELGCKGPDSGCDAPLRLWNSKTNWCCRSGGPCIGCTEPTFPDHRNGLYAKLPESRREELLGQPKERADI